VSAAGGPRGPASLAVLRRLAATAPTALPDECCELCGVALQPEHRHVVDLESRGLLCACRACWLLFPEGAQQRYRAVPERHLSFPSFTLSLPQWEALEIPVGLAFFLRNSLLGRLVALYPGPAGAAESALPLGAWNEIVAANPELDELRTDVEALLFRVADGAAPVCFLVPVDRCYELVGRLRRVWRGFDGGTEARAELAAFLADVGARARPVGGGAR